MALLQNRKFISRLFFSLAFFEGLIALYFLFSIPSEKEHSYLLGFSFSRLFVIGIAILGVLFLAAALLYTFIWQKQFIFHLDRFFEGMRQGTRLLSGTILLSLSLLSVLCILIIFNTPISDHLNTLKAIYQRINSLVIWCALLIGQTLVLLYLLFKPEIKKVDFWNKAVFIQTALLFGVFALTFWQWLVFIATDAFFTAIPGWYWQYTHKDFKFQDLCYFLLIIVSSGVTWLVLTRKMKIKASLLLIFLWGYSLQIGMGFVEGGGIEAIREKFVRTGHNYYALHASDDPDFFEALTHFEGTYTTNFILGTKPPGGLAFYMLAQKASNLINPVDSFDGRHYRLTLFAAYFFPLLASLVVFLLYKFIRIFSNHETALWTTLLFIFCPNFVLISLQLDQFLYPSLFLVGLLLTHLMMKKRSWIIGLILGFCFYLCVYISFSLIPLISMCAIWTATHWWVNRKKIHWIEYGKYLLAVAGGFALAYGAFYLFLNYDALTRYQNGLAWHRAIKIFDPGLKGILNAIYINVIEYSLWTGIPVLAFSLLGIGFAIIRVIKNKSNLPFDWFAVAFFINNCLLNLLGQTRSEVGRLWFFQVPIIVWFAFQAIAELYKEKKSKALWFIIGIQVVTIFITFKFQDFY